MKMTKMGVSLWEAEQLIHGIRLSYGLDILAVVERRTVCGLVGTNVNWIWKPALENDDEQRLYDLARMTHYISQQGLPCGGPIPNRTGRFITIPYQGAKPGYLQMWLPGRHVNVTDKLERHAVIRAIAKLHMIGKLPVFQMGSSLHRGRLLSKLRMKQRTLQGIWSEANTRTMVLSPLESYIFGTMEHCIFEYENWLRKNGWMNTFCHRDLAPHNLLWNQSEDEEYAVSIIDFDHSGFDDPLHDVMQFTSHTIFLSNCTANDLEKMITTYAERTGLSNDRFELLCLLLRWPDILIRTVVEWYRHGYEQSKEIRVNHAVMKEEKRRQLLTEMLYARKF
jgi:Ser/Thr protein kinase RdoA (MazF antagonist)